MEKRMEAELTPAQVAILNALLKERQAFLERNDAALGVLVEMVALKAGLPTEDGRLGNLRFEQADGQGAIRVVFTPDGGGAVPLADRGEVDGEEED